MARHDHRPAPFGHLCHGDRQRDADLFARRRGLTAVDPTQAPTEAPTSNAAEAAAAGGAEAGGDEDAETEEKRRRAASVKANQAVTDFTTKYRLFTRFLVI